ncbi:hypothetical protein KKF86_06800, partial [bacterium]|nr:hypothetical protein [bacterium]
IILLFSFFIISTCTNNYTITGNNNETSLGKPSDIENVNSNDPRSGFIVAFGLVDAWNECFLLVELFAPYLLPTIPPRFGDDTEICSIINSRDELIEKSYDFRDNYLSNSDKGNRYIDYYRKLSKYSISNNIIGEYYKEHLKITPVCVSIAHNVQYGSSQDQLLFNKTTYDDLKTIVKIYRNSPNHREIESVLDYLEADLDKYYNKSKFEIASDFK